MRTTNKVMMATGALGLIVATLNNDFASIEKAAAGRGYSRSYLNAGGYPGPNSPRHSHSREKARRLRQMEKQKGKKIA